MGENVASEETRRRMEATVGPDFVKQLRRADDWLVEALLYLVGDDDADDDAIFDNTEVNKRVTYCAQAAVTTNDCHGWLWPHLKFETQKREQALELAVGMIAKCEAAAGQLQAANLALGTPPRKTGSLDIGTFKQLSSTAARPSSTIMGSILSKGALGLVFVEQRDEKEGVLLELRGLREDPEGALLVELVFMVNRCETFQSPASLQKLTLQALVNDHGGAIPHKVTCAPHELKALCKDLSSNSERLSVACHMKAREAFAGSKKGADAVDARVVREPLELSFLKVTEAVETPKSVSWQASMDIKQLANDKFAAGCLEEALELYRRAVQGFSECEEHTLARAQEEIGKVHSNMAECYLRQERWAEVVQAASAALVADTANFKALFRRAKAREAQGKMEEALADVGAAARLEPKNQLVRAMLQRLRPATPSTPPPKHGGPTSGSTPPRPAQQPSARDAVHNLGFSTGMDGSGLDGKASAWAAGLSPSMQHEWLVDCYRMHVDDQYAWGGGELRGLYLASAGGGSRHEIANDFLLFCKLAAKQGVVPSGWDWPAFLAVATRLLPYAFEKSDAQEKYGRENVFAAAMGGRSLRYTAEIVYGASIMSMEVSDVEAEMEEEIRTRRFQDHFYADVGGAQVWRDNGFAPVPRWTHEEQSSKGSGKHKGNRKGNNGGRRPRH
eukprot:3088601-Amphidinium_carterae.1